MVIVMILHSGGPPTPRERGDGHTDSNDIVLLDESEHNDDLFCERAAKAQDRTHFEL